MRVQERQLNLVVALLETRRPLTFDEIRGKVRAYDQSDHEAARRMFERDKDALRRLGVPVRTAAVDAFSAEHGYRIDRREYEVPPIDLEPAEVAALALALQVTGEDDARPGLVKLTARAPDPGEVAAPTARVHLGAPRLDTLAAALFSRQAVRFGYRTAAGNAGERTVDPYGVVHRNGDWYLVGFDHDRDSVRAFRLDRFASEPVAVAAPAAFEVPTDLDVAALVAGPVGDPVDAEIAFDPRAGHQAGSHGGRIVTTRDDGWHVARFEGVDRARLLPWVVGLGADAEVLAPPDLRAAARDWFAGFAVPAS